MAPEEFFARWGALEETFQRYGAQVDGASLCARILADVRSLLEREGERSLTLAEASRLSGYSSEHLGRLVRDGSIRNMGRKGSPRIRLAELPKKPRSPGTVDTPLAPQLVRSYDADTDARTLLQRQRGGRHG